MELPLGLRRRFWVTTELSVILTGRKADPKLIGEYPQPPGLSGLRMQTGCRNIIKLMIVITQRESASQRDN